MSSWLAAAIIGAGMSLMTGCASVPAEPGDLVYYDDGYGWWWCEGVGWTFVGFYGHGRPSEIARHRPPEHGEHPRHGTPGHPPPCYYFVGKGGRVLASDDGRSYREAGAYVNGHFVPDLRPGLPPSWYLSGAGRERLVGGGALPGRMAARPIGGFQRFVTNAGDSIRGHPSAAWSRPQSAGSAFPAGGGRGGFGGWSRGSGRSSGGGWNRSSASGGGGGGRGGSWSGGGGGGRGGGERGGGGGGRGSGGGEGRRDH